MKWMDITESHNIYCMKSVCIRSFCGLYFPAFVLNTEKYSVSLNIQPECGKIRTRKTPNTGTFHAVIFITHSMNLIGDT